MMLLGFSDYENQSRKLAVALDIPFHIIRRHDFPDGECKLNLPAHLPGHTIFCRSLNQPNEKLIELLLAAKTARTLGAKILTLVTPYLCYMRQDKEFHAGETVSQKIVGNFLADLFDNIITVDPHLHRINKLHQAVPATNAISLTATSLMSAFLSEQFEDPVILGPDSESEQWVNAIAKPNNWQYGVCKKIRKGDQDVEISLPDINLRQRVVIITDDVVSSGQTLAVTIQQCLAQRASHVDVLVTHALFADKANELLKQAGVRNVWSTDSISHDSNILSLCGLLKSAVLELGQA